jgi:hypothetical protein
MLEFRQLDMGISTSLYFPAIGTAGLLLVDVRGDNLVPDPPPKTIATTFLFIPLNYLEFTENFDTVYYIPQRFYAK